MLYGGSSWLSPSTHYTGRVGPSGSRYSLQWGSSRGGTDRKIAHRDLTDKIIGVPVSQFSYLLD